MPSKTPSKKSPFRVVVNNAHSPLPEGLSNEEALLLLSFRAGHDTDKIILLTLAKIAYSNNCAAPKQKIVISTEEWEVIEQLKQACAVKKVDAKPVPKLTIMSKLANMGGRHA